MNNTQEKLVRDYIVNAIDSECYEVETTTTKEKLTFLFDTFKKEYGYNIERYGIEKAFSEWLMGLPSSCNIDFYNCEIVRLGLKWKMLTEKSSEDKEDAFIANWFKMIQVVTFDMFKEYAFNPYNTQYSL